MSVVVSNGTGFGVNIVDGKDRRGESPLLESLRKDLNGRLPRLESYPRLEYFLMKDSQRGE